MSPGCVVRAVEPHLPGRGGEYGRDAPAPIAPSSLELAVGGNRGTPASEGIGRGCGVIDIVAFIVILGAIIA